MLRLGASLDSEREVGMCGLSRRQARKASSRINTSRDCSNRVPLLSIRPDLADHGAGSLHYTVVSSDQEHATDGGGSKATPQSAANLRNTILLEPFISSAEGANQVALLSTPRQDRQGDRRDASCPSNHFGAPPLKGCELQTRAAGASFETSGQSSYIWRPNAAWCRKNDRHQRRFT